MVSACEKAGVTLMAGHVMNFFHGVRQAKQMIGEGKIGKVLCCHSARNGWEEPQPSVSWKKSGKSPADISTIISTRWIASSS